MLIVYEEVRILKKIVPAVLSMVRHSVTKTLKSRQRLKFLNGPLPEFR